MFVVNYRFHQEARTQHSKISPIHYHDDYELYYLLKGTTKYIVDKEIFSLKEGDFIFIPKSSYHYTNSELCTNTERILISFDDTIFDSSTQPILEELYAHPLMHIPLDKKHIIDDIINKLRIEHKRPDSVHKQVFIKIYTLELLTMLCRQQKASNFTSSYDDILIEKISNYIKENFSKDISLTSLSTIFAMNHCNISHKFKAITGIPFSQYLTLVRLSNAEKLLLETNLSINEISLKCGFNDSNYFSNVFKKHRGISPLTYKKNKLTN